MNPKFRIILVSIVLVFAAIGLIMTVGLVAIDLHLTDVVGIVDNQHGYFKNQTAVDMAWSHTPEWLSLKVAIGKDQSDIERAALQAGIPPRLIVAPLVVEQLRLFTGERDLFKSIFQPLVILGVQSQFSWGVMGIKEDTARQIEDGLRSSTSTFYLGAEYAHLLDFTSSDVGTVRFQRLTDEHSRYYSYLYAALYEKELLHQWAAAGIDISNRPDILFTLFNIGFSHSMPHQDPQTGGAEIDIAGHKYSFGGLAADFYYSDELPQFTR